MGAALGRSTSAQPPVVSSKGSASPKFYVQDSSATADDEASSSALIHADAEPSEPVLQAEERLQIRTGDNAEGAASNLPSSMLCCFTSGSNFQSLGSPKFGSLLWQGSGSFKFLTRTLSGALLPPMEPELQGRLTVVLDLDETLVHSSFVPVPAADFVTSVPVDGEPTNVWVYKRPYLDYFLREVAAHFEVVVFTASLATYADVVLDIIDQDSTEQSRHPAGSRAIGRSGANTAIPGLRPHASQQQQGSRDDVQEQRSTVLQAATHEPFPSGVLTCVPVVPNRTLDEVQGQAQHSPRSPFTRSTESNSNALSPKDSDCCKAVHHRLYRGSCVRVSGSYIKDLSRLGRNLARTVIVDNSPTSFMWNPESAIPSVSFIDDKSDFGLLKVLEILMYLKDSSDVREDLPGARAAAAYYVPLS